MKPEPFRVMQLMLNQPWAITQPALAQMLDILDRRVSDAASLEAVAARIGRPLDDATWRAEVRGSTAVLNIDGPIVRYAGLFGRVSGLASIEALATDFQTALDNPEVRQILLNVDSPGGQADGINEAADMIRAGDAVKPVYAYVGGQGASAAYWLASAARRITINESAFLGSVGMVIALEDRTAAGEKNGVKRYEFVSSQSPRKRPDPSSEAGRQQLQEMADSAAQLFIERVAGFRKVSIDHVLEHFGRGGMVMGRAAIRAQMADDIGSLEGFLTELNSTKQEVFSMAASNPTDPVVTSPNPSPPQQQPINTAETERTRIAAILALDEAKGHEAQAQQLALTPGLEVDSAKRILAAAPKAAPPAPPANPLATAMGKVPNPKVGVGTEDGDDSPQAEAARILAFLPAHQRVKRSA